MTTAASMDMYNSYKQKVFGVLNNFYWCKVVLRPKCIEKLCYKSMRTGKI